MADTFVVKRSAKIAAPPETVFAYVGDLESWDAWSPWAEMDPDMTKTFSGESGAVGSTYRWSGNRRVGEGQMTITKVDAPNQIAIDLKFIKPFKSENVTTMTVSPTSEGSEVNWQMEGPMTLMAKIMGIFKSMDKMVGPDFEKGLGKLKRLVEAAS